MLKKACILLLLFVSTMFSQSYKIIESNDNYIIVEANFSNAFTFKDTVVDGRKFSIINGKSQFNKNQGEPLLPESYYSFGIPFSSSPNITILKLEQELISNKFILPVPEYDPTGNEINIGAFDKKIYSLNQNYPNLPIEIKAEYVSRYSKIMNVFVSPYQFNPVKNELQFNKIVRFKLTYNEENSEGFERINDKANDDFLKTSVINYDQACNWAGIVKDIRNNPKNTSFWYNPNKEYFKIYLKEKGVYRIKYEDLVNAGLNKLIEIPTNKLELYCDGVKIPIDVFSKEDSTFAEGDYFQFCGYPPTPTPYSNLNIYNNTNVYWFSYQADTTGYQFKTKSAYPLVFGKSFETNKRVLHFEQDVLYERFGLAEDLNRDFWMWGKASGENGIIRTAFSHPFESPKFLTGDSTSMIIRVGLSGTLGGQHKADIELTSQPIGSKIWSGQKEVVFETTIKVGEIGIFPENNFQVYARGVNGTDEIRINWYEIEYWQNNSPFDDNFIFSTPSNIYGKTQFIVYHWTADTMIVYNPKKGEVLKDIKNTHNQWEMFLFVDDIYDKYEYFCTSLDHFLSPDSIKKNANSDLRDIAQGADYIIITYPNFTETAEKLANYRETNLPGYSNPRVKVVNVYDIYNEFSFGLLNPYAIQDFIKYAFNNWQIPAPNYVVLLGDMSYDYRNILPNSRKNYIPSIPIFTSIDKYGQSVSDNQFVAVVGNDVFPDLSIGRLSCETNEEANNLVDKVISYPSDNSKEWKQNVLLFAAGESQSDEVNFKFNDESLSLESNYILPYGFDTKKVFMFNNSPAHAPYIGDTYDLIEDLNEGGVFVNFFGHGGGYQWDAIFLSDHIYMLQNLGRQPFISSITCYTAHYENQDVFGEQFVKVPNKGAIGFFGNPAPTLFLQGKNLNRRLFQQVFTNHKYVVGDAIRAAKNSYITGYTSYETQHIQLFTLLGDPAIELCFPKNPEFSISSSSISTEPAAPLVDEMVEIKIKIRNYGITFNDDSVAIKLTINSSDSSYNFEPKYLKSFGEYDSLSFYWTPKSANLFAITAEINYDNKIVETDFSDNLAKKNVSVYNIKEVNIISPRTGFSTTKNSVDFVFADPSDYLNRSYSFYVEIDTSLSFNNPIIISPELFGENGIVNWNCGNKLVEGSYFWRTRIEDVNQEPLWSETFTFSVNSQVDTNDYVIKNKQLQMFESDNIYYNNSENSLILNLEPLPPRPDQYRFIENIIPDSVAGLHSLTAVTTDGTYFIVGHMAYYGQTTNLYKFGTGFNGTDKGKYYGMIPCDTLRIWNTIFYLNGSIYAATGNPYYLTKIDPISGNRKQVEVPDGMLDVFQCAPIQNGAFYLKTDGKLVYNLTAFDSLNQKKYQLRIFDPENGFQKVGKDIVFGGNSYDSFTDFFVADGYVYPYENLMSGFMRRLNISTGEFEGNNWATRTIYQGYYSWVYDYFNDRVYASVYKDAFSPKFGVFYGTYNQTYGITYSPVIKNTKKWLSSNYSILNSNTTNKFNAKIEGLNKNTNLWDVLIDSVNTYSDLTSINENIYGNLRYKFTIADSSVSVANPIQIKSIGFNYIGYPEVLVSSASFDFSPDSLMQGFPIDMSFNIKNYGYSQIDSLNLKFMLNNSSTPFFTKNISIKSDSVYKIKYPINTSPLLFNNKVTVEALTNEKELFDFNNISSKSFYVSRDSTNPAFDIKFDGEEIINGDIISAKPLVTMTMTDNSPLPLDSTYFYIYHNNIQVPQDSLHFSYTPYPNSTAIVSWNPTLKDGTHYLEVLARDASLNYFDTTSYKIWFTVNNNNQIREIFNYPNPFTSSTYFTFNMLGTKKPEEIRIKIFTIAGRLIKNLEIPTEQLKFGFNKFYWDGKDEDGDEIGNGVYFYKIIIKEDGEVRSETKKIAKIR